MVSTPSTKSTGAQCWAISGPTICGHRPMTAPTATSTAQPALDDELVELVAEQLGVAAADAALPDGHVLGAAPRLQPGTQALGLGGRAGPRQRSGRGLRGIPDRQDVRLVRRDRTFRLARGGGIGWGRGGLVVTHSVTEPRVTAIGATDQPRRHVRRARPP